jgi:polysaccharide export outer membrane protein
VGDALTITFADLAIPVQPLEQKVKDDGTITLLLNQTFVVTNKTVVELQKEIRERYVPVYFRQLTPNVVQRDATRFYYVSGEVKAPARQVYIARITVRQAIASCGDFTDFARKSKVKLTRSNGQFEIVDIVKVIDGGAVDPEVFPGDKIHVPRKWW